uniref:Uncharacterized protein n=1 Tax=Arundo donax TaxID=35708 RepID=A0A0A8ZIS1_ARUDO
MYHIYCYLEVSCFLYSFYTSLMFWLTRSTHL